VGTAVAAETPKAVAVAHKAAAAVSTAMAVPRNAA
jgi:hypothetical protein